MNILFYFMLVAVFVLLFISYKNMMKIAQLEGQRDGWAANHRDASMELSDFKLDNMRLRKKNEQLTRLLEDFRPVNSPPELIVKENKPARMIDVPKFLDAVLRLHQCSDVESITVDHPVWFQLEHSIKERSLFVAKNVKNQITVCGIPILKK